MNNGESLCGVADCDYSELHELPLVQRIMHAIEQYNRQEQAEPCPACLRDAMLAVAALLHLRAGAAAMPVHAGDGTLEQEFTSKARERLHAVTEVVAGSFTGLKQ